MRKFIVALLYNLATNAPRESKTDEPWDVWNELDSERTVAALERALRDGGHQDDSMEGDKNIVKKLERYKVDIAFNTCEGHRGASREAQIPAILDLLRIPHTGSGVKTLALALDKAMTKRILQFYSIPTPAFQTFLIGGEPLDPRLNFPLLVKPVLEGSGIGLSIKSICKNPREVREQVKYVLHAYKQPALVEEFIQGRELTLGLIGNLIPQVEKVKTPVKTPEAVVAEVAPVAVVETTSAPPPPPPPKQPDSHGQVNGHLPVHIVNPTGRRPKEMVFGGVRVFPPMEVDLSNCPPSEGGIYTSVIKSQMYDAVTYYIPARLNAAQTAQLARLTVATFRAVEACDFARVDFRLRESDNKPFVLEINPLAGLSEGVSDLVLVAESAGVDYTGVINGILDAALKRYGMI
jgi:D-alanine-D-alanine ligase